MFENVYITVSFIQIMKKSGRSLEKKLTVSEIIFVVVVTVLVSFITLEIIFQNFSEELGLSPFVLGGGTATRVTVPQSGIGGVPSSPWSKKWQWEYPGYSYLDGPEGRLVGVGNGDSKVFSKMVFDEYPETLFDVVNSDPAVPIFNYDYLPLLGGSDEGLAIDASEANDIFAVVVYRKEGFTGPSKYILRVYDSAGLLWEYDSFASPAFGASYAADVAVSGDGNKVVVSTATSSSSIEVTIFDLTLSNPELSPDIRNPSTIVTYGKSKISEDLSSVLIQSGIWYTVYDILVDSLSTISSPSSSEFQSALPAVISDDGSLVAIQTLNGSIATGIDYGINFYKKQGNSYAHYGWIKSPINLVNFGPLAISGDKSTFTIGWSGVSGGNTYDGFIIQVIDLTSGFFGTVLMQDSLVGDQGGGSLTNLVSAIDISANGQIIAVGSIGDGSELVDEVLIYNLGNANPNSPEFKYRVFENEADGTGSVRGLDLSNDGTKLVVAASAGHPYVSGQDGGGIFYFERA